MALSQAAVIKLILKYIGGSKIKGSTTTTIDGKPAMTKNSSLEELASRIGAYGNSAEEVRNAIFENPKEPSIAGVRDNMQRVEALLESDALPQQSKDALAAGLATLNDSVERYQRHTNILAGITVADEFEQQTQEFLDEVRLFSSNAEIAAEAAFSSANSASVSANGAATSASEAATSAFIANTAAGNSAAFAAIASTAATSANSSAASANTSATLAASFASSADTSANNASISASAAQTSANSAAASANGASTSASQAATAAFNANTAAANSAASATIASTAATSANSSSASANTSATLAATYRSTFNNTLAGQFPREMEADLFAAVNADGPANDLIPYSVSNPDDVPSGHHYLDADVGNYTIHMRGALSIEAGRLYKIVADVECLDAAGSYSAGLYGILFGEGYGSAGNLGINGVTRTNFLTNDRFIIEHTIGKNRTDAQTNITDANIVLVRPAVLVNRLADSTDVNNSARTRLHGFWIEDITESTNASVSASAAQTSANSAAASANGASTSASQAATSAFNANTSAANSAASAVIASTAATNANNSAAAASTSEQLAAEFALITAANATAVRLTPNGNFDTQLEQWFASSNVPQDSPVEDETNATYQSAYQGETGVLYNSGLRVNVFSKVLSIDTSRVYKVHANVYHTTTLQAFFAGVQCFDASGTSLGFKYPAANDERSFTGWAEFKGSITGEGTANDQFPVGTKQVMVIAFLNQQDHVEPTALDYLFIEDVTESTSAALSASASQVSSASAASSANGAATSASQAATSAFNANTAAANSAAAAANAATAATSANSSAASANSSATLAASFASAANTSANNASISAAAAQSSANSAAASANGASTSASQAATSAFNANTSANTANARAIAANASATAAAASATSANSSAASANTSATLAAQYRSTFNNTLSNEFPRQMEADLFAAVNADGPASSLVPYSVSNPANVPVSHDYLDAGAGTYTIHMRGALRIETGRLYKISLDVECLDANGGAGAALYGKRYEEGYSTPSNLAINGSTHTSFTTGQRSLITHTIGKSRTDAQTNITDANIVLVRPAALVNRVPSGSSVNSGAQMRIHGFWIEDITESTNASISATASQTSANSAAASANGASTSASQAATSAFNANTSANTANSAAFAANASATAAAASATSANSSAASANTSATLAASFSTNAELRSATGPILPKGFEANGTYWAAGYNGSPEIRLSSDSMENAAYTYVDVSGEGRVVRVSSNGIKEFGPVGAIRIIANRTYRLKARWRAVTAPNTSAVSWLRAGAMTETYAFKSLYNQSQPIAHVPVAAGWVETSLDVSFTQTDIDNGHVWLRPEIVLHNQATATFVSEVSYISIEDVTESVSAQTSATVASASAASANASAASAQQNSLIAASLGLGSVMSDSRFADWTSTSALAKWNFVGGASRTLTRIVHPQGPQQYAARMQGGPNSNAYLAQTYGSTASPVTKEGDYWVATAKVRLVSGRFQGAGMFMQTRNSSSNLVSTDYYKFYEEPDATGQVVGNGVVGQEYTFSWLVKVTPADAKFLSLFGATHYVSLGDYSVDTTIDWSELSLRPATNAEIRDQTVLAPLESSVTVNQSAIATLEGAAAHYEVIATASGSNNAIVRLKAGKTGSDVDLVADRVAIYNGTTAIPAMEIIDGNVTFTGELNVGTGSGARVNITENLIQVFDANNTLRVRMGVW